MSPLHYIAEILHAPVLRTRLITRAKCVIHMLQTDKRTDERTDRRRQPYH